MLPNSAPAGSDTQLKQPHSSGALHSCSGRRSRRQRSSKTVIGCALRHLSLWRTACHIGAAPFWHDAVHCGRQCKRHNPGRLHRAMR